MSLRVYLASLLLVLALAGCSAPETGIPDSEPGISVPPSNSSSPPDDEQPTVLASVEACDLLTPQQADSLGLPQQGEPDEIAGLRRCDWTPPGGGGIATGINEDSGIDELNLADASGVTDVTIGQHQAKRSVEGSGPGYCEIVFAVGDNANVSVLALYLNDTPRACAAADKAAALVEPKLP